MDVFQYIIFAAELLAALAATIYYSKYKYTKLKWLLPLLWYITINERVAYAYSVYFKTSNALFYNIYDFITSVTILWLITTQIHDTKKNCTLKLY